MPHFSLDSISKLQDCVPELQEVFHEVIKVMDCQILCGHRGEKDQNEAFNTGASKLPWPQGDHNKRPSNAVDAIPYPVNWKDFSRMKYFAGMVIAIGYMKGYKIQWGGDWDMDTDLNDQNFNDLPHFAFKGYIQ